MARKEQLEAEYIRGINKCPQIKDLFYRFTHEAINSGRKNFGSGAIYERMRWETKVNPEYKSLGDFKLNNNFRAFLSRDFMNDFPEHKGFFRTRIQISEKK